MYDNVPPGLNLHLRFRAVRKAEAHATILVDRYGVHLLPPKVIAVPGIRRSGFRERLCEGGLYLLLAERRGAALYGVLVAVVAEPDIISAGSVMPHFVPIERATVATDDALRKRVALAGPRQSGGRLFEFFLDHIEHFRINDGFMRLLNQILPHLAVVLADLFCEKIHRIGLHKKCIAHIFFVGEDALNRRYRPVAFPARRRNTPFCKGVCDVADRVWFPWTSGCGPYLVFWKTIVC